MEPTAPEKPRLRAAGLDARRRLEAALRERASEAACARLLALPELGSPRTVAVYLATADELDPGLVTRALAARGVRLLAPRVTGVELVLAALTGPIPPGFHEPAGPAVDTATVDVVLVPGVAFDAAGGRIGRGTGHYDRLLARLRPDALRVGLCFAVQLVPEVPREPHDEPVDVVVTEQTATFTHARG